MRDRILKQIKSPITGMFTLHGTQSSPCSVSNSALRHQLPLPPNDDLIATQPQRIRSNKQITEV